MMTKSGAQDLIAKGKLPEAIAALLTLLNDYLSRHAEDTFTLDLRNALISNAGKLAELSQSKIKGIVHREDENLTFSRVSVAVLEIIERVPVSVWANTTSSKTITEQLKASKLLQDFIQKYGDNHPTNAFVELHETVVQTFGAYDDWSLLRVLEEMAEENKVRQEAISVHIPKAAKAFVANHQGEWKPAQWLKFKGEIFAEYGEVMSARELADFLEETKLRFKEILKDFVFIKGGEFMMGAPDDDPHASAWEKPQHQVRVSDFYMCKYTVTIAQFEAFKAATGYQADTDKRGERNKYDGWNEKGESHKNQQSRPVIAFWGDAIAFCNYWNSKYGFSPVYDAQGGLLDFNGKSTTLLNQVHGFRLPSEAEWEYACRAGTSTRFYTGDTLSIEQANFKYHLERTQPVGSYAPNPWGLYDMHGNIFELCLDSFDEKLYEKYKAQGVVDNPLNFQQFSSVIRGGEWRTHESGCRSSLRGRIGAKYFLVYPGFRMVFVPPPGSWLVPS